jgi:hypothetical protein
MSNETTKRRGRPAGSTSFVKVKLQDLIALVGEGAVVPVSKIYLRENSIDISQQPVKMVLSAANEIEEQPKIEFSMTSFE